MLILFSSGRRMPAGVASNILTPASSHPQLPDVQAQARVGRQPHSAGKLSGLADISGDDLRRLYAHEWRARRERQVR